MKATKVVGWVERRFATLNPSYENDDETNEPGHDNGPGTKKAGLFDIVNRR
jgi:hypothetical protein